MLTFKSLFFGVFALLTLSAHGAEKQHFTHEPLKEFTSISLNILPDSGVQLIFPFMLDNPTMKPSIKMDLTNNDGFQVPATKDPKLLIRQNTITVVGNRADEQFGNLFINVGGYNVVASIRLTHNLKNASPNVIFDLSEDDRTHLITHTVDQYKEALDKEHKKAMDEIDIKAREEALKYVGDIMLKKPDYDSFKLESDLVLGDYRVIVYVDELVNYRSFASLVFEIDNPTSRDINIDSITLSAVDSEDVSHTLRTQYKCPETVRAGKVNRCTISSVSPNMVGAERYEMTIATDLGSGVIEW